MSPLAIFKNGFHLDKKIPFINSMHLVELVHQVILLVVFCNQ